MPSASRAGARSAGSGSTTIQNVLCRLRTVTCGSTGRGEQADQPAGTRVDDLLLLAAGRAVEEVPVTLDGVGETIAVRVPARALRPGDTSAGEPAADVTAIAVPYFQWDNRDGGPMRVWQPAG